MPRTRHHNDGDSTANVPNGQAAAFATKHRIEGQSEARLDRSAVQRDRLRHGRIALNAETEHHRMPVVWQNDNPKSRIDMVKRNYDMKGVRIDRDMSDFELLAEANGDKVTYHNRNIEEGVGAVYCVLIGDDCYVGSTTNVKNRSNNHISMLALGKHKLGYVQEAYNRIGWAKVYVVMYVDGDVHILHEAEAMVIRLMRPSLNRAMPKGDGRIVWRQKPPLAILRVGQVGCPWCGYPIDMNMRCGHLYTEEDERMDKEYVQHIKEKRDSARERYKTSKLAKTNETRKKRIEE